MMYSLENIEKSHTTSTDKFILLPRVSALYVLDDRFKKAFKLILDNAFTLRDWKTMGRHLGKEKESKGFGFDY